MIRGKYNMNLIIKALSDLFHYIFSKVFCRSYLFSFLEIHLYLILSIENNWFRHYLNVFSTRKVSSIYPSHMRIFSAFFSFSRNSSLALPLILMKTFPPSTGRNIKYLTKDYVQISLSYVKMCSNLIMWCGQTLNYLKAIRAQSTKLFGKNMCYSTLENSIVEKKVLEDHTEQWCKVEKGMILKQLNDEKIVSHICCWVESRRKQISWTWRNWYSGFLFKAMETLLGILRVWFRVSKWLNRQRN